MGMKEEKEIPFNDQENITSPIFEGMESEGGLQEGTVAQFFIFQGEDYLGWDCFHHKKVSIGRGKGADLVLDGQDILDIHVSVYFRDHHIIVSAENSEHKVIVNGKHVHQCILRPFDYLTVGPYTLKVKLKRMTTCQAPDMEVSTKDSHLPSDPHTSKADPDTGREDIKAVEEDIMTEMIDDPEDITISEMPDIAISHEEEDEEEDDDIEGLFSLKAKIMDAEHTGVHPGKEDFVVEVVQFRKDDVVDVCFLHRKEKYYRRDGHKRFCLAAHKDSGRCYFFFNSQYNGQVSIRDTHSIDLSKLRVPKNIYRKRRKIYRDSLPKNGSVFIQDGHYEYLLRRVPQGKSPQISETVKKENYFLKNVIKSSVFHIIILLLGGLFLSLRGPSLSPPPPEEPRFVQIDTRQIADNLRQLKRMQIKDSEVKKKIKQPLKRQQNTKLMTKRINPKQGIL